VIHGRLVSVLALSTSARWPAQGHAMVAAYKWLLEQGVSPQQIAFAGDSAGGNLAVLTAILIRDNEPNTALPACIALQSPWLDMTATQTANHPNSVNDFMFDYANGSKVMNSMLRPEGTGADSPAISALLQENVGGLPPQLVAYSPTELLASDSERWIKRSKLAGVDITEYALSGEMHTFALGWPVSSMKVQDECDRLFYDYLIKYTNKS
jgi:epsilon-lactone hydrolase